MSAPAGKAGHLLRRFGACGHWQEQVLGSIKLSCCLSLVKLVQVVVTSSAVLTSVRGL